MEETDVLVNRVAQAGLLTLDLEELYVQGPRLSIDLKYWLYEGLILREKDYREKIAQHGWSRYEGSIVSIFCTEEDTLIPAWAYMILMAKLSPFVRFAWVGEPEQTEAALFAVELSRLDVIAYSGARMVIKGCSKFPVPSAAYAEAMRLLTPIAQSVMYGEPCSSVPVYKAKRVVS